MAALLHDLCRSWMQNSSTDPAPFLSVESASIAESPKESRKQVTQAINKNGFDQPALYVLSFLGHKYEFRTTVFLGTLKPIPFSGTKETRRQAPTDSEY